MQYTTTIKPTNNHHINNNKDEDDDITGVPLEQSVDDAVGTYILLKKERIFKFQNRNFTSLNDAHIRTEHGAKRYILLFF